MKRVMLLAAMLAMVLAAAAPAFAQAVAIDEGDDTEYNGVCQNILGSIGNIDTGNTASANADSSATADDDSAAAAESVAEIAQDSGVSIEQANECFNNADFDDDGVLTVVELKKFGVVVVKASASTAAEAQYTSATAAAGELPETGGAPLIALGVGTLLVAGGLVARRIVR